jgi:hypothetical protein
MYKIVVNTQAQSKFKKQTFKNTNQPQIWKFTLDLNHWHCKCSPTQKKIRGLPT